MYGIRTLTWVKMDPSLQGARKNPTRFGDLLEADKMNTDQAFMLAYEHFAVPKLVQRQRPKVRGVFPIKYAKWLIKMRPKSNIKVSKIQY